MARYLFPIIVFISINCGYTQTVHSLIDQYISTYVEGGDFSGCVKIVKSDTTFFSECYGWQDKEKKIRNSSETKFMIGSISKQLTAFAMLKLSERGKLKLSDPISKFVKTPGDKSKITILQLLTHTSGIKDIFAIPGFQDLSEKQISKKQIVDTLLQLQLDFLPGSQYQYSNGGYTLLSHIIEKVSNLTYSQFINSAVFDPLQLNDFAGQIDRSKLENLATGYEPLKYKEIHPTVAIHPLLIDGSGSLYSSIDDLCKWIQILKERTFLSSESYDKLFTDYGNSYGLGISVYQTRNGPVFGHDGRINGFIADYLHYEKSDVTIALLGNIQTGVADFFRTDIAQIVLQNKSIPSRAKKVLPAKSHHHPLQSIVGSYSFGPSLVVHITAENQSLLAQANEGGTSELIPLIDGSYFSRTLYAGIRFIMDDKEMASGIEWISNDGRSFKGKRIHQLAGEN